VTTVKWKGNRRLLEYPHLRPCRVLERHAISSQASNQFVYTVQILNRYGLREAQRVTSPLIVTHVPRAALRLSDKIYTTDQHLPQAFRHEAHLPDEVFPLAWRDLV